MTARLLFSLSGLLLLNLSGCHVSHSTIPPELPRGLSIPQEILVAVEPIEVVADIERNYYEKLCNPYTHDWPDLRYDQMRAAWKDCGGVGRLTRTPGPSESLPILEQWIMVGQKRLTLVRPEEMHAELVSALDTISGLRISPRIEEGGSPQYTLRVKLTELSEETEGGDSTFGVSGLPVVSVISVFYAVAFPDKTYKGVHVQFDVELVDTKTFQIVAAFPATGSYWGSFVSNSFFRGSQAEPLDSFIKRNQSAVRDGIYQIATLLPAALDV